MRKWLLVFAPRLLALGFIVASHPLMATITAAPWAT
jgi:hypothetical protein